MSKKPTDLTPEAMAGYRGEENHHLATSPCWCAHEMGRQLGTNRRLAPTDVRMGRGDSIWTNGVRWAFGWKLGRLHLERVT